MSARAESLAKQFEARAAEMTATIEKLSEADWKKVTSAEQWSVGVTAHHVAEWRTIPVVPFSPRRMRRRLDPG